MAPTAGGPAISSARETLQVTRTALFNAMSLSSRPQEHERHRITTLKPSDRTHQALLQSDIHTHLTKNHENKTVPSFQNFCPSHCFRVNRKREVLTQQPTWCTPQGLQSHDGRRFLRRYRVLARALLGGVDSCSPTPPPPLTVEPPPSLRPRGDAHIWQTEEPWRRSAVGGLCQDSFAS